MLQKKKEKEEKRGRAWRRCFETSLIWKERERERKWSREMGALRG